MPPYSLGAHNYFFSQYGQDPVTQIEEALRTIADAGFPAVEMYAPNLRGPDWRDRVLGALARTGLRLVGVSNGQPYWDIGKQEQILSDMEAFCQQLTDLGLGSLHCGSSCSGKRLADRTEAENEQCVRMWARVAQLFRDHGHRLNYHTHGEPIEDIRLIVDHVPADLLELGPDLDWLRVGGVDPEELLRAHAKRLSMLHIRDYHLGGERTEALGEGDADYRRLARTLDEIGFAGEFVVELALPRSGASGRSALELLRLSREHLRDTMGL